MEASVICSGQACLFYPLPTPASATTYVHINHKGFGRCAITTEKKKKRKEGSTERQRKASAGSGLAGSVCAQLLQSCPILCEPVDCSPPGSSVHRIPQARILEWVAMPSSRGSSRPRDRTQVSHVSRTGGQILPRVPPGKSKPSGILALILLVAEAVFPLQFRMGSIPYQIDPLWGGASPTNTK